MKSKFSIKILESLLAGILLLFTLSAVLIAVFTMPSIAFMVKAGTTIVSLVILIIIFRSAKFKWNKLRIENDGLYISPFMGLWTNKVSWDRVSGIERSFQRGEDTDTKILYIYINNVRKIKISDDYYRNMYDVYRSLLRKTKVFGSEYTTLRRQPELEKPVVKLWTLLAMGVPCFLMLGGFTYTMVEQILFAKRAISVTGSITALHQNGGNSFAAVSFVDQQGHEHQITSRISNSIMGFKEGERVQVLFSRDGANNARIDNFIERWLLAIILGAVGVILGVGTIWVLRKRT